MSETIGNLSLVIASIVALYGVRSWQVELRGRRRMEIAEETLVIFYRLKDVFAAIRSPMSFVSEGKSREPEGDETPSQKRARDLAQVVFERFQTHHEEFNTLISVRYRFLAVYGRDSSQPFEELLKIKSEILLAARMLAEMWVRPADFYGKGQNAAQDMIKEKEKVIWWAGEDDDPISKRIDAAIDSIEKSCRPSIGEGASMPSNFWSSLIRGVWWR